MVASGLAWVYEKFAKDPELFKNQDKAKHSINNMCTVLQVSETGYYKWLRRQSRPYKYDELLAKIRQIRADNPDYGAYRIYLDLQLNHI